MRALGASFRPGGFAGSPWRNLTRAIHGIRIMVGCTALAVAWILPAASITDRILFAAVVGGLYVPYSVLVFVVSRGGDGTVRRVIAAVADLLVVFMFQALFPQTRVVALIGYLLMVAFQTAVGGLPAGGAITAGAVALTVAAQAINPAQPRTDWFTVAMFTTSAACLAFLLERTSREQRRALRELDETVAELERARTELDDVYGMAHIGSWRWDISSDRVTGSPELFRILGVSGDRRDANRTEAVARVHPDDREKVDLALDECVRSASAFNVEIRMLESEGGERWVDARGHAITENEDVIAVVGTAQDITERKDMERLRREFVSMVSHDLRTPLTSIKGFAELIRASEPAGNGESGEYLGYIERSADELESLTDQLLEYSRLETGQAQISSEPIALDAWVASVAEQLAPVLAEHEVTIDVPAGLEVEADELALRRVLTNLLQNAAKFAPSGTRITVRGESAGDDVRLSVSDEGPGIPPAERERVFEAFYRGSAQNHRGKGTGLGLAISRRYVELHGGRIRVENTGTRGTTISFEIPRYAVRALADSRDLSLSA